MVLVIKETNLKYKFKLTHHALATNYNSEGKIREKPKDTL